jgi:hypothetical protein
MHSPAHGDFIEFSKLSIKKLGTLTPEEVKQFPKVKCLLKSQTVKQTR